jgi:hypothetical protein
VDNTSTHNTTGHSGGVVGTLALLLALCGIVGAAIYAHHASNEATRLSKACDLLGRQCQALRDELNRKPDLNEVLGSKAHREFIQKELATGSWYIPGKPGEKGPQGDKGLRGEPGGPQGPVGPRGLQGRAGTRGVTGPQGIKGDAGGPAGPQGPMGEQGQTGSRGTKGDRGLAGAIGPQGVHGITGADGQDGTLPIWELCASLALAFLGIYLGKAIIDMYCRKYRNRHGSITFEYDKGAWS